ncbi:hypothetical protein SAY87_030135 [Trapa incisa]|uniref:Receptor ligand binding region domain-containing protein n=1 Tax=Trapa incisa TaxID=236973 RepID=A0AAN7K8V1_9MYRT|nr:hypothetical protein SAY87_030135 [Trapa incisa]
MAAAATKEPSSDFAFEVVFSQVQHVWRRSPLDTAGSCRRSRSFSSPSMSALKCMARAMSLMFLSMWTLLGTVDGAGKNGSALRPRIVNIGALFTYDSVIGRSAQPAIQAAIDDVNADPHLLQGTTLNLIVHDTNCSGFLGTVEGIYSPRPTCCFWNICTSSIIL